MDDVEANSSVSRTTRELALRLGGARAQDLGLIGGMIGGLIGVMTVVGVEDAQGWY